MELIPEMQKEYWFYVWDYSKSQVRWMCAWDTTQEDVDGLLKALAKALGV
jgi:threonine aldolase